MKRSRRHEGPVHRTPEFKSITLARRLQRIAAFGRGVLAGDGGFVLSVG
jgi:hypothetical protein